LQPMGWLWSCMAKLWARHQRGWSANYCLTNARVAHTDHWTSTTRPAAFAYLWPGGDGQRRRCVGWCDGGREGMEASRGGTQHKGREKRSADQVAKWKLGCLCWTAWRTAACYRVHTTPRVPLCAACLCVCCLLCAAVCFLPCAAECSHRCVCCLVQIPPPTHPPTFSQCWAGGGTSLSTQAMVYNFASFVWMLRWMLCQCFQCSTPFSSTTCRSSKWACRSLKPLFQPMGNFLLKPQRTWYEPFKH